jgi:hypothetical protein
MNDQPEPQTPAAPAPNIRLARTDGYENGKPPPDTILYCNGALPPTETPPAETEQ